MREVQPLRQAEPVPGREGGREGARVVRLVREARPEARSGFQGRAEVMLRVARKVEQAVFGAP